MQVRVEKSKRCETKRSPVNFSVCASVKWSATYRGFYRIIADCIWRYSTESVIAKISKNKTQKI